MGKYRVFRKHLNKFIFQGPTFTFFLFKTALAYFLEKQSLKQKNVVFSFQFGFVFVIKRLNVKKKMCYKENVSISVKKKRKKKLVQVVIGCYYSHPFFFINVKKKMSVILFATQAVTFPSLRQKFVDLHLCSSHFLTFFYIL